MPCPIRALATQSMGPIQRDSGTQFRSPTISCMRCGGPLSGRQVKYCSRRCQKKVQEAARRNARREFIRKAKSVPCADCGIEYPPPVMEFDHVRGTKRGQLSDMYRVSVPRILREMEKCDVVCANCHRMRTHEGGHHLRPKNGSHFPESRQISLL